MLGCFRDVSRMTVLCVKKVKYMMSCLDWLVSVTWCIYGYEYVMSWFRVLELLFLNIWMICDLKWWYESLLCEKPWLKGKVKIVEA